MQVSSRTASLESKLAATLKDKTALEVRLDAETSRREQLEEAGAKSASLAEATKRSFCEEISDLKKDKEYAEAALETEKSELGKSRERRSNLLNLFSTRNLW